MAFNFLQRGGLWVAGQGILLLALAVSGPCWRGQWHEVVVTALGTFLLVVASLCGIAGTRALGRNLTPYPQPSSKTRLVQNGIYAYVRHPLYTAVTLGAIGWALVWASWPALLTAFALGPFFDAKARREERWLRGQFTEYAQYEQRVRRFLPWIY